MYTQYYLQARDAADKIRNKQFEVPKTEQPEGFMPRKGNRAVERLESERQQKVDYNDIVLKYMSGVQGTFDYGAIDGSTEKALQALATVESSGRYDALGPVMKTGSYKGDRAYGKYQVMGKNIPSWTKEALGVSMTPEEFLSNTSAQDLVAAHFMKKSYDKYGNWEDAASVWFTGRPLAEAGDASDGYTSVQDYVSKFKGAMA